VAAPFPLSLTRFFFVGDEEFVSGETVAAASATPSLEATNGPDSDPAVSTGPTGAVVDDDDEDRDSLVDFLGAGVPPTCGAILVPVAGRVQ
jgi:hypothetical protein